MRSSFHYSERTPVLACQSANLCCKIATSFCCDAAEMLAPVCRERRQFIERIGHFVASGTPRRATADNRALLRVKQQVKTQK
jgi:hypothetical protein